MSEAELEALGQEILTFQQPDRAVNVRVAHLEGTTPFAYLDPSEEQS